MKALGCLAEAPVTAVIARPDAALATERERLTVAIQWLVAAVTSLQAADNVLRAGRPADAERWAWRGLLHVDGVRALIATIGWRGDG